LILSRGESTPRVFLGSQLIFFVYWRVHLLLVCIRFRLVRKGNPGSNRCAEKSLVRRGLYRYSRIPCNSGVLTVIYVWANPLSEHPGCIVRNRRRGLLPIVRSFPFEEPILKKRFGHRVTSQYCAEVPPRAGYVV